METQAAVTNPSGYQYVTFTKTESGHFFASRQLSLDVVQPQQCLCVVLSFHLCSVCI